MPFNLNRLLLILNLMLVSIAFTNCKSETEIPKASQQQLEQVQSSMKDFTNKSTEYRSFPIEVAFFDQERDANNIQLGIQNRRAFIKMSGLPDESNIDEFKKAKTTTYAYGLYLNFITKNSTNPYLKTFKQYGAWLLLTRLDLLAQSSFPDLQMIYALVGNLTETQYEGYQLLGYAINHLYSHQFDKKKIKTLCTDILSYANDSSPKAKMEQPNISPSERPLPPEIQQSIKKYNDNKEKNKQEMLSQINNLLSQI
jgi:hypothetical protein